MKKKEVKIIGWSCSDIEQFIGKNHLNFPDDFNFCELNNRCIEGSDLRNCRKVEITIRYAK